MAIFGGFNYDESAVASTGLTSSQYYIVKSTALGAANLCTGSSMGSAGPWGILQNDPDSGQAATVRLLGRSLVSAGSSAIGVGAQITASTAGQAITAVSTGAKCIGWARTASAAIGDIITVDMLGTYFYSLGATA